MAAIAPHSRQQLYPISSGKMICVVPTTTYLHSQPQPKAIAGSPRTQVLLHLSEKTQNHTPNRFWNNSPSPLAFWAVANMMIKKRATWTQMRNRALKRETPKRDKTSSLIYCDLQCPIINIASCEPAVIEGRLCCDPVRRLVGKHLTQKISRWCRDLPTYYG